MTGWGVDVNDMKDWKNLILDIKTKRWKNLYFRLWIGNTKSVINILDNISILWILTNNEIVKSSHYILPGVGSYKNAIYQFKKIIPISTLENEIFKKKPLMGICVECKWCQLMDTSLRKLRV